MVCNEILPRWGVETVFVDGDDLSQWEEALSVPTQAVFFETPSNPMQSLVDIAAVCDLAHAAGAKVVLDNVFATPMLQQGFPLGADVVVYSGTKHIDGQGRVLGGAILGDKEYIDGPVQKLMRHTGPAISPFNAWTLLKGLETLAVRVDYQNASAHRVAEFLEKHPAGELGALPVPGVASAVRPGEAADDRRRNGRHVRAARVARKERAFEVLDKLQIDRHLQQPRRREVVDHPPGHHHAPGDGSGGPRRDRARRRRGADLGGAGGHRGSDRATSTRRWARCPGGKSEAKKARRKKRRAAREANWLPETVLDELVRRHRARSRPSGSVRSANNRARLDV